MCIGWREAKAAKVQLRKKFDVGHKAIQQVVGEHLDGLVNCYRVGDTAVLHKTSDMSSLIGNTDTRNKWKRSY